MISKEDFIDWKNSPVTKRVFDEIKDMIQEGKEEIAASAGINPLLDRERVGKLNGLTALLGISFYDFEDKDVD